MRLFATTRLAATACCAAALAFGASTMQTGKAGLKSAGALAIGPDGVLFVGDTVGGAIFALEVGDSSASKPAGNLEIATLKAGNKLRQDELSYVGNLLDEYARTFESRINVCELQSCGEAVLAAKQAGENDTLTQPERFARQLAFVDLSV